ncbi:G-D-S-L family lipolytic protein [Lacinutrix sp. Bg11-31]|uniref:G-D-S-L family lipolytic protein n=1 Tax=Lacinutrix sp. Bg11-31 TaxID=2057808 RepID=UPI000C30BFCB|nr:G-D-S-L family lipolytic protein [Lacinutrix sp. Bg11-31]AUC83112.1 G-D-S-L family lipolytic protein [Lacinutrix sp. Bg11-31]
MKTFKNLKYIGLVALAISFTACNDEEDFEEFLDQPPMEAVTLPALNAGSADFSNYIAVGASFTAGFTDGGLFIAGQEDSFPNTIAKQFENAGGGTFTQPLTADNFGGLAVGGNRIQNPRLVFGGAGPVPLESLIGPVTVGTDLLTPPTGPFNNFGVPGAKSFHLIAPGYGNLANLSAGLANPYAVRLTGATPNASMVELAVTQNPSFFTLSEIGGNDVLGYATTGGDGTNPITPTTTFDFALNAMVTALTSNGAKGAIGNVPNITSLSHFTTIPYNPVPLDAATAAALNQGYATYNGGLQFAMTNGLLTQEQVDKRTITFSESANNALVLIDENLTNLSGFGIPSFRQATEADLFVLPLSSLIPQGYGTQIQLEDKWVLTPEEQLEISTATTAYNNSIAAIASANGLALVDLNTILNQAASTGVQFDDYNMNTSLVTGGLVSLDGIHLTARGSAIMANSFLDAIDTTYGSNFRASGNVAKAEDFGVTYSPLLQ